MIDELDIFRAAKVMIDHHGDEARAQAISRRDQFQEQGNDQVQAVWQRIIAAIEAVQLVAKPVDEKVH